MSVTGFCSNPDEKIHKPFRKRNVSGELDVFEATRYFSELNEPITAIESRFFAQKQSILSEQRQDRVHPETEQQFQKRSIGTPTVSKKLTNFLNSLFRSVRSKKTKPTTEEEEIPAGGWWRRRRRSSISHLQSNTNTGDGACVINAPRKSFDGFTDNLIYKHVISSYQSFKSTVSSKSDGLVFVEKQGKNSHVSWLEDLKSHESLWLEQKVWSKSGNVENGDEGEGYESDLSSDLFELDVNESKSL